MKQELIYICLIWSVLTNIIGFIMSGLDKYWAIHKKWRVAEKRFILLALLGGGLGVFGGCVVFNHKIRNRTFMIGIPAVFVAETAIAFLLIQFLYI